MDAIKVFDMFDDFEHLYEMLSKVTLYKLRHGSNSNRHGFPDHRGCVFGFIRPKFQKGIRLSRFSRKCPEIYQEILRIGAIICPFEFRSIQVNHNLVSCPHLDKANCSESIIISFGEYQGCKLVVQVDGEDVICDTFHRPHQFDGSKHVHYNTPFEGESNKYSLVFFS